jgi:hypothetical protein
MLLIDEPAIVRRPAGVVCVRGPDRVAYLQNLLSQSLEGLGPGSCADTLYLDAKGNALAAGRAVVHAQAVLLVVPPAVAADLAAALEKYKFLTDVEATDVSGSWVLASLRGPLPLDVPGARAEPMTATPAGGTGGDELLGTAGLVIRDRSGGIDLLGTPAWVEERSAASGLPVAGLDAWEAWRITNGEPAWGSEIVPGRRPQELGLLPTHVHLRKGCYPGQESIAKTYNLGRPRRALAVVRLDGPASPGDRLQAGTTSGEVTSVTAVDGGWVALALLPVDRETGEIAGEGAVTGEGTVTGRVLLRVGAGLPQPGA